ncbi:hypothetical protein [Streptosporangium pseudovulgare]|uniref:Uncharacterized protein n=1 Tax=Streptosporangium pseudovulgare TaxID=35765 RepID=A0ABQ2RMJ3_9ACTN|nr:hypothetical protein [Streptosporangium pseudovulgare]GGQ35843.1 hypothetical protein GCM10010140_77230 [Streptosporangium pseudovulgare]
MTITPEGVALLDEALDVEAGVRGGVLAALDGRERALPRDLLRKAFAGIEPRPRDPIRAMMREIISCGVRW